MLLVYCCDCDWLSACSLIHRCNWLVNCCYKCVCLFIYGLPRVVCNSVLYLTGLCGLHASRVSLLLVVCCLWCFVFGTVRWLFWLWVDTMFRFVDTLRWGLFMLFVLFILVYLFSIMFGCWCLLDGLLCCLVCFVLIGFLSLVLWFWFVLNACLSLMATG